MVHTYSGFNTRVGCVKQVLSRSGKASPDFCRKANPESIEYCRTEAYAGQNSLQRVNSDNCACVVGCCARQRRRSGVIAAFSLRAWKRGGEGWWWGRGNLKETIKNNSAPIQQKTCSAMAETEASFSILEAENSRTKQANEVISSDLHSPSALCTDQSSSSRQVRSLIIFDVIGEVQHGAPGCGL